MPDRQSPSPVRVLELRSVRGTGGGPEKTILEGAARTDSSRYEIVVCYIRDRRDEVFAVDRRAAGVPVEYIEIVEKHSFDVGIWPQLRRLISDRSIDVIHSHDYKTNLLALLLGRRVGVIPLATAHGWTGHSRRERSFYYPIDRRVLARFPVVIAVSEQIRGELLSAGGHPSRIVTILNGIDHVRFRRDATLEGSARARLGFAADDFIIGGVGRLEPQKRFDVLIQACAALQSRFPRLRLVLAGDGSLKGPLEAQAQHLLAPGTWQMLGHCPDIALMHHSLDLLVQSSDYEGTPNAVLEAMALETPIVATTAGGTAEMATDRVHALLVRPGDSSVIAAAIEQVLTDPVSARERVRTARLRVEQELSFERRMRKVESIYDSLVARYGRRSNAGPAFQWA